MSYQVFARKYRPQRFADVVGQQGVTQTLRNAIQSGRIAHSYIFAGARGVGKTTTARILAKALNCVDGPTVDPCGQCDACVEIAEGRNIDVVEIDAATNTKLDETKAVIIDSLATRPARDRFKIFIIDEVHQLSRHSFNALLKSIEEPPPHVVFMMATTELHKIPDTIRSRSQEFEFRTISTRAITDQLARIAEQEHLQVEPAALALIARSSEGSMRDAESSFDQVIAFAGDTVTAGDVSAVLGLVARDLLLDIVETVADENAPRVFDLAARAIEAGQDLRLLCRELSRVVRDMMVINIDPARAGEPEFAPEGDTARLTTLAARFSREDLLRAFDVVAKAEQDIRASAQPRYQLEMALLKWIYLRKVQPIDEVLQSLGRGAPIPPPASSRSSRPAMPDGPAPQPAARRDAASAAPAAIPPRDAPSRSATTASGGAAPPAPGPSARADGAPVDAGRFRETFFEQIRQKKRLLHGTLVAQAQRVDVTGDVVTFHFTAPQRVLQRQVDENKGVLEQIASDVAGRPMIVRTAAADAPEPGAVAPELSPDAARLRERALADTAVQAMLDVFPAEITDVEEIDS